MQKKVNFIILNINAYANFPGKDMAGAMRIKNLFDPLLADENISVSNLVIVNPTDHHLNGKNVTAIPEVDSLCIGYQSLVNPVSIFRFMKAGMKFIREHRKKNSSNIIYNYQHPDISNIFLLIYAKYKGYKVVFDLVEDKKHERVFSRKDKLRLKLSMLVFRFITWYADIIFAISHQLISETSKLTGNKMPLYLLPISVNFSMIDKWKSPRGKDGYIKIFYGGSFADKDGLQYLVRAIEQLDKNRFNFKLVLSGKGEPADMEKFFGNISDKSLIDYKGFLPAEEYYTLLNTADICCITRENSAFANAGFPFKLGEFLAAGKLVIASRTGDVEKYLVHKESAWLVTPGKTEEIAEGLSYLMENLEPLSQTMGAKAREVAMTNFESHAVSRYMLEKCSSL